MKVADVDGDAALDIVFCNTNNGSSYSVDSRVYHQRSGAFSTAHITDLATVGCADVEVGDVNGDGYTDIVFASLTDGATYRLNSYVYPGGPAGFLPSARYGLPSYGANDVEVADFNNDGYDDVVVTAQASMVAVPAARTYLYWGGAAGTSDTRREQWGIDAVQGAKAADLNGDGYVDLVLAHSYINDSYTSTSSAIYWGTGTGFLSTATRLPTEGPTTALIGDLDDDGHPELIFPGYRNGGGYASATTPIYWGAAGAPTYATTSVTTLAQGGGTRSGLIVGDSAW